VWRWASAPEPFRIPTTAGQQRSLAGIRPNRVDNPASPAGVIGRMALEVLLFRSLFRNTRFRHPPPGADLCPAPAFLERKGLWLGALVFHWSLLVIAVRHLRLFVDPVPGAVTALAALDGFLEVGLPRWYATDVLIVVALGYLLVRRMRDPLVRYLSLPADYVALGILLAVAGSGLVLRYAARPDLTAVRAYTLGLAALSPGPLPAPGWWLAAHVTAVAALLAVLPYTKMAHALGVWLSPTRNQANDSRRRRHVNPWNAPVAVHTYAEWREEFRDKLRAAGLADDGERPADAGRP
jgi:nitrate reductase gamma subunit